jgi:hypothetical protein
VKSDPSPSQIPIRWSSVITVRSCCLLINQLRVSLMSRMSTMERGVSLYSTGPPTRSLSSWSWYTSFPAAVGDEPSLWPRPLGMERYGSSSWRNTLSCRVTFRQPLAWKRLIKRGERDSDRRPTSSLRLSAMCEGGKCLASYNGFYIKCYNWRVIGCHHGGLATSGMG